MKRLSKVKRDALEFLIKPKSGDNESPFELWETLKALSDLARDGELGVIACTVVPTQDGNEGDYAIAFDLAPSTWVLGALERK